MDGVAESEPGVPKGNALQADLNRWTNFDSLAHCILKKHCDTEINEDHAPWPHAEHNILSNLRMTHGAIIWIRNVEQQFQMKGAHQRRHSPVKLPFFSTFHRQPAQLKVSSSWLWIIIATSSRLPSFIDDLNSSVLIISFVMSSSSSYCRVSIKSLARVPWHSKHRMVCRSCI